MHKQADVLRYAGLRATKARCSIVSALERADKPLSIQQLYDSVADTVNCRIDQATVYRTVNTLLAVGIIRRVSIGYQHEHYELVPRDDHHHVICTRCGYVTAVTLSCTQLQSEALAQAVGFSRALYHTFDVYGVCSNCAADS
jgi:Fe2+ or Zn2+ uptake regulation protein